MPCGIAFVLSLGLGYFVAYKIQHLGLLPLWAAIIIGVLIVCLGIYLEFKYGIIEF